MELGSQWTNGQARVHLDREATVGRCDEHATADPDGLGDHRALPMAIADVLDHRIGEHDVELTVREGERARVALNVRDLRIPGTKALPFVQTVVP